MESFISFYHYLNTFELVLISIILTACIVLICMDWTTRHNDRLIIKTGTPSKGCSYKVPTKVGDSTMEGFTGDFLR